MEWTNLTPVKTGWYFVIAHNGIWKPLLRWYEAGKFFDMPNGTYHGLTVDYRFFSVEPLFIPKADEKPTARSPTMTFKNGYYILINVAGHASIFSTEKLLLEYLDGYNEAHDAQVFFGKQLSVTTQRKWTVEKP